MPEGPVVADSGPLIAFSLLGRLDLLRDAYTSVLVPEAVWREVTSGAPDRPGVVEIPGCPWLVRTAIAGSVDGLLRAELGPGEAEAITQAVQLPVQVPHGVSLRHGRRNGWPVAVSG